MAESKDILPNTKSQGTRHLPDLETLPSKRQLTELNTMFKDYMKNFQDVHNDECTLSKDLSTLKDEINEIGIQVTNLEVTEFELQNTLQKVSKYPATIKQLHTYFELLGYSITNVKNDDENEGRLYEIEYSNKCSIIFRHNQDHTFELVDIKPNHLNFTALKELLKNTQDVQGFLFNISQYFDTIVENQ